MTSFSEVFTIIYVYFSSGKQYLVVSLKKENGKSKRGENTNEMPHL
ncbi:hypothetical protein K280104A7_12090 [Candidatus Bariatricus faecipullorum]